MCHYTYKIDFFASLALKFYFLISCLRLVFLYSQNYHGFIYAIISSTYCTFEHNKFHSHISGEKEKVLVQDLVSEKQLCRAGRGCVYVSTEKRADKRAGQHPLPSTRGSKLATMHGTCFEAAQTEFLTPRAKQTRKNLKENVSDKFLLLFSYVPEIILINLV